MRISIYDLINEFNEEIKVEIFDKLVKSAKKQKLPTRLVEEYKDVVGEDDLYKNLKRVSKHISDDDDDEGDDTLPWGDVIDDITSHKLRYVDSNEEVIVSTFADTNDKFVVDNKSMFEQIKYHFARNGRVVNGISESVKVPTAKTTILFGAEYYETVLGLLYDYADGRKLDKKLSLTTLQNISINSLKMTESNNNFAKNSIDTLLNNYSEDDVVKMLKTVKSNFRQYVVHLEER